MRIGVIVEFKFKPGSDGPPLAIETMSQRLPSVTRGYDGCEYVHLYVDPDDPTRLVLLEPWESRDKYDAHQQWANSQPGTVEIIDALETEARYTYLDDTGA